jgi:uncharacterized protein YigA (DUF484 family)
VSTQQQGISSDPLQEHAIADYLRDHPEFFATHAGLLADIRVPHHTDGAISLIEHQVAVLREKNHALQRQLHSLVQVARDNDRLNEQMQRLTLALLEASDLHTVLRALGDSLANDFRADASVLGLFMAEQRLPHDTDGALTMRALSAEAEGAAAFASVLNAGKPLCGHLRREQRNYLFADAAEENVASALVVALSFPGADSRHAKRLGLLGIGSRDARRYHPGMGTMFLNHLGELVGRAIGRYLPLQ